eukprot:UN00017
MAVQAIRGIQSEGVMANAKHYINNNQEIERNSVVAQLDWRTSQELYSPPFEASVDKEQGRCGIDYVFIQQKYDLTDGPKSKLSPKHENVTHVIEKVFMKNEV